MALRPISRIDDYSFPADAWDVRGWSVRTRPDDTKVGRVADMLLDGGGTLRYLDVNLGILRKHVLVPLDHAYADPDDDVVWIEQMTKDQLQEVPEYALDPEALDENYERRLDALYGGTAVSAHRNLFVSEEDEEAELELRRLDAIEDEYRVAGDDPRGWKVVTGDGRIVGRVAELLVAPGAMRTEFLDIAVDEEELELEPVDRHVLLPAGRVRLDRKKKNVVVSGLLASDMASYPQYGGLPIRRRQARELDDFFGRAGVAPGKREERTRDQEEDPHRDWRHATLRHFYRARPRSRAKSTTED